MKQLAWDFLMLVAANMLLYQILAWMTDLYGKKFFGLEIQSTWFFVLYFTLITNPLGYAAGSTINHVMLTQKLAGVDFKAVVFLMWLSNPVALLIREYLVDRKLNLDFQTAVGLALMIVAQAVMRWK